MEPANWSGGILPTSRDTAFIDNGGTAIVNELEAICRSLNLTNSSTLRIESGGLWASGSTIDDFGSIELRAGTMSAQSEDIGRSGTGMVTQSGGTNKAGTPGSINLGYDSEGVGIYDLSGGHVSASRLVIGYSGTGVFSQSGGLNTVKYYPGNPYYLFLGYNSGSSGTYNLGGSGQLTARREYIGYNAFATALFQQTGGHNATSYLCIVLLSYSFPLLYLRWG